MGKSINGKELGAGIYQRKSDGLYYGRYKNRFGSLKTVYGKTFKEVRANLTKAKNDDIERRNVISKDITLDEWYQTWLKTCKRNCRDSTLLTYRNQYRAIQGELGWRKLTELNLINIQEAINKCGSDNQRKNAKKILSDMLNKAVQSDLITKNPCVLVNTVITKEKKNEKRIPSEAEFSAFISLAKDCRYYNLFIFASETGLRVGEIMALTWEDVKDDYIDVNKTMIYYSKNGDYVFEIHEPKTYHSIRKVPLSSRAKEALKNQKEKFGIRKIREFGNLVFFTKGLKPTTQFIINDAIDYVRGDIPHFSIHSLRHYFATRCVDKGVSPKVLQRILGHSQLQLTMDLYCHVTEDSLFDAIKALEL